MEVTWGFGERKGSCGLMGTEFQFGKMKVLEVTVVMAAPRWECASCP